MAKSRKIYTKKGSKKTYTGKKKVGIKSIKKLIKREIHRNLENKSTELYDISVDVYPTNNTGTFDGAIIPLQFGTNGLQVTQGLGQGGRIGDEIHLRKVVFAGTMFPTPYDATLNPTPKPVSVRMVIFADKTLPTSSPLPATNANIFQYGSTALPFQNRLTDLTAPFNEDRYMIMKSKVFKLGYQNYQGTGLNAGAQAFANNDFKLNHSFKLDITKHCIKRVKFNDTSNTATTRGLWAMFIPVNADNSPIGINEIPAGFVYSITAQYEDA